MIKTKAFIYLILIFIAFSCREYGGKEVVEYFPNTRIIRSKKILANNDSTSYAEIVYYKSGVTKGIYEKKNYVLTNYTEWFESGKKFKQRSIIGTIEIPYTGDDTVLIKPISFIETIGIFKIWNENGILIYETNLLPNRKEQQITRDSIGRVLKIDTISY